MNLKKVLFAIVFVLLVSVSRLFADTIGIIANYSPFKPSFWSAGVLTEFNFFRAGMSFGSMTVFYDKENPYSSKREMTEYWQRSMYIEFFGGGLYQINLIDNLALRLGGDLIISISPAYGNLHSTYRSSGLEVFNWAFTGLVGIKLFPKRKYFVNIDVCPGWATPISALDLEGAFIMPIRLSAGINLFR